MFLKVYPDLVVWEERVANGGEGVDRECAQVLNWCEQPIVV